MTDFKVTVRAVCDVSGDCQGKLAFGHESAPGGAQLLASGVKQTFLSTNLVSRVLAFE